MIHLHVRKLDLIRGELLLRCDTERRFIAQGIYMTQELGRTVQPGFVAKCCYGRMNPAPLQAWAGQPPGCVPPPR